MSFKSMLTKLTIGAALVLPCVVSIGCQSTIAGQTLPSAYYLSDDIRYNLQGPDNVIWRQTQALDQYRAEQTAQGVAQP